MRKVLVLALAVLVLAGCAAKIPSVPEAKVDVDTPQLRALKAKAKIADCVATTAAPAKGGLPDSTMPCLGGGPGVNLAGLRGPMVVNLWAQWCVPCRREMPHLAEFARRYGAKVPVLGIDSLDQQPALALEFARDAGARYPLVADPAQKVRIQGGLPNTILIDKDGKIAYQLGVEIKSVAQLKQLVADHLGVHL